MPNKRHVSHRPHEARRSKLTGLWIGLGLVVVIGAAFLLLRPRSPKTALPSEVPVGQAHDLYQQGALFVDVRTQAEWDQGHLAGSILIPLDQLQDRLNELPRDKDIVVICHSGARSQQGAALLKQSGFTRVTFMTGGLQAWVAAGYPLAN